MNKPKEIQAWYFKELGKEQSNAKVYRMKGMVRERINKRLKKIIMEKINRNVGLLVLFFFFFWKDDHWATVS